MAKSSRASSRKANNQRLKARVFGPVEIERNARLSAKLLELAAAPKPERPEGETISIVVGDDDDAKKETSNTTADAATTAAPAADDDTTMDVDTAKSAAASTKPSGKKGGRIEKRRKTSKIVFPKYGDKSKKKRKH